MIVVNLDVMMAKRKMSLNELSEKLQKRYPKHKDSFERIKYMSYCESVINRPIPFINFYARGMHMFGGVPTIISKGAGSLGAAGSKRDDINNQVVTKVRVINNAHVKN